MSVTVVTSCSLDGWRRYGMRCLSTILTYWPKEVAIHLVSEDALPLSDLPKILKPDAHRVFAWPLMGNPLAADFYNRHIYNKICRGMRHSKYNFREDAWRFSKKVFALDLVAPKLKGGKLIWLDADTVTFATVPLELLRRIPPEDNGIAYLNRPGYHSECGWVTYNLEAEGVRKFIARFAALYHSSEVFKLKEWHDSWVFDWLRKQMPEIKNWAIPHTNTGHPFVHSELGRYMDHLKGDRKKLGVSVDHPRFKRRKPAC